MPSKTFIPVLAALWLAFVGTSTNGHGETVFQAMSETVQGSERTHIGEYVAWESDCASKPLKIEMIDPPKHGELSQEDGPIEVTHVTTGTIDDCKGREIIGILLFYQAEAGFRGEDVFKFRYRFVEPDDEPVVVTFTVTVE